MRLFSMRISGARALLVHAGAALAVAVSIAGCGNNYRPVVTPVYQNGPAAQPASFAVVVSAPSPTSAGIATIVDYSGDTVMAIAPIGVGPKNLAVDETGSNGFTVNSDGTLSSFPVSTSLQAKNVVYSTLKASAQPINLLVPQAGMFAADLTGSVVDVFGLSPPLALKLSVPVALAPVAMVDVPSVTSQREYAISQGFSDPTGVACNTAPTTQTTGFATPIEYSTNSADPQIQLGICPVYGIQSSDQQRVYVLNRGDDTVSVINSRNNALDACTPFTDPETGRTVYCHPTLPLSQNAVKAINSTPACQNSTIPPCGGPPNGTTGMTATAGPVYAEYNVATSTLVVANYDGGTISVIDVSLDEYGNDSPTFGTTYTIPVGNNPASVTVLYDGSRAYTANQTDGTVTIVNLTSHTVEKTLTVVGHPRTVSSTQNSLYGKVYVASPDSPYVTIISTVNDLVDTTVLVQGNVVDVHVSTQNGTQGNGNVISRMPGYGEPCNMPPGILTSAYGVNYTLAECQSQNVP